MTGGSIIIPIDIRMEEVTMSMIKNGKNRCPGSRSRRRGAAPGNHEGRNDDLQRHGHRVFDFFGLARGSMNSFRSLGLLVS